MAALFAGRKKCIKNDQVRIITVPRLAELSATNLKNHIASDPVLSMYVPEIKPSKTINRQFLFNIINTIKPDFFPENIRNSLYQRKVKAAEKRNRFVDLTSDLYDLLMSSNRLIQGQKGRAIHMLNIGAKKRKQPDGPSQRSYPLMTELSAARPIDPGLLAGSQPSKRMKPNESSKIATGPAGMIQSSVQQQA